MEDEPTWITMTVCIMAFQVRKLSNEYAMKNFVRVRQKWPTASMTYTDWVSSFMKRHSTLSIRIPQPTTFNRYKVNAFFDLLEEVRILCCQRFWNLDSPSG